MTSDAAFHSADSAWVPYSIILHTHMLATGRFLQPEGFVVYEPEPLEAPIPRLSLWDRIVVAVAVLLGREDAL